ncbi:MAG: AAA family ATPase [Streptococcus salivarius]
MSEYNDRTAVSKLIGATAGYVGYDDNSNTLTERIRRNPYSIVLLDEIEKLTASYHASPSGSR